MKVEIINKSKHQLPAYATDLSAGMDLRANIEPMLFVSTALLNNALSQVLYHFLTFFNYTLYDKEEI